MGCFTRGDNACSTRGTLPTRYTYTGQYSYANDFGLVFYNTRWYDPLLSRWAQPDTIIPDPLYPSNFDRYAYVRNNPVRYNDPSGHCEVLCWTLIGLSVALVVWLANPTPAVAPEPGYTPTSDVDPSYGDKAFFDAAPGTGDISDAYTAITGHTLFTGEEVSTLDRIGAGVFTFLPLSGAGFRQGRKFIDGIDNLMPSSNTVVRQITGQLDLATKNLIRQEARSIFYNTNPQLMDMNLQIHHRIPLEWAHLFPNADPNRLSNLIGLEGSIHLRINGIWNEFRAYYKNLGRSPTTREVLDFAAGLDYGN